ncbi:YvrJ family protein [Salsuginibacillus kocurii]|uniref:YvrJ family protein n=1 Tax=Salsuginibacillus kocurii TaxID=427078 RepID=UPI0003795B3A|nr:YvrJ family protein [Salsuginibacillus kocurii]
MDWAGMIAEVSFPILVTFYLLTRIETRLSELTRAIDVLKESLPSANQPPSQLKP